VESNVKLLTLLLLSLAIIPVQVTADTERAWKSLLRESHSLHRKRQYDEAGGRAQQAIELAERAFGTDDPKLAQSLRQLAYVYSYQRRYDESVPLLERALVIIERHYGPAHAEVADYLRSSNTAGRP